LLGGFNFTPAAGSASISASLTRALLSNGASGAVLSTTVAQTATFPLTANASILATTPIITDVAARPPPFRSPSRSTRRPSRHRR